MKIRLGAISSALFLSALVAISAQQPTPPAAGQAAGGGRQGQAQGQGRGNPTAPPPIQWPSPPPPSTTIAVDTGVQHMVWVVPTRGLTQPWSMAFLPDGAILITERPGCLRIVRGGRLEPDHVAGLPPIQATGLGGLMDLALHPRFSENQFVYLTYHKPAASTTVPAMTQTGACAPIQDGRGANAGLAAAPQGGRGGGGAPSVTLARGRWNGTALVDVKDIFTATAAGNPSRIVFGRDGTLFMSVGSGDPQPPYTNRASVPAQDPSSLGGKVLRLKDDGTVPPDNPFVGRPGYRPEIYSMGHRNIEGLTVNPVNGDIWASEQGPNGGDEVNVIKPGANYGWPLVSHGRFYLGPRVNEKMYMEGMEQPTIFWVPAIATSGLTFYTGDKFPNWKNNLFAGGMRQGEVPRSGHLERLDFNENWEELHREGILRELQQRIRDVRQGPDGLLYLLTAENDGALLRLEPAPMPPPPAPVGRGGRGGQ
jgi:glucose/arabinose dehydrogenase